MRLFKRRSRRRDRLTIAEYLARRHRGAWYADPYGEAELRWWNGSYWTPHVHGRLPRRGE